MIFLLHFVYLLPQIFMSRSAIRLLLKHESGMIEGVSPYIIKKKTRKSPEDWQRTLDQLTEACFVYVGNLSFFTSEAQIYEYFSQAGSIKRVIMVCYFLLIYQACYYVISVHLEKMSDARKIII